MRTRPLSEASRSFSFNAAPRMTLVWISCPQACITPACCELNGTPLRSSIGSASMSARSATSLLPVPISATSPVARS